MKTITSKKIEWKWLYILKMYPELFGSWGLWLNGNIGLVLLVWPYSFCSHDLLGDKAQVKMVSAVFGANFHANHRVVSGKL